MEELNPYAAPSIPIDGPPNVDLGQECWRDGVYLVATHQVRLPPRSVIDGSPASRYEKLQLVWYPSWIMLASLLAGPLFFLPLMLFGYRLKIEIPLDKAYCARRSRFGAICVGLMGLTVLLIILAANLPLTDQARNSLFAAAALSIVAAIFIALIGCQAPLSIRRVDKHVVWLTGAGEAFLATLPEWPR
jgi:hypothetical protein